MRPLGRGAASLAGAFAFVAIVANVFVSGSWRDDFRVDEAHKISETAFLRLWLRGDVGNIAWFDQIIDRTNPPVGKYVFGTAILLTGQPLPTLPTLAIRSINGGIPPMFPDMNASYGALLTAVRSVSIMATALTAALLTMILARAHGWMSAAAAFLFFSRNSLTGMMAGWAVFDPLLALFVMTVVALIPAMAGSMATRRIALIAAALGVTAAMAFQTRLNGLYALIIAIPFLWITLRHAIPKALAATAVTITAFIATTLAVNPLYWSTPATPLEPFSSHHGPMRPIQRLWQQFHDLQTIAGPYQEARMEGRTLGEKARFLAETLFFDLPGLLLAVGAITGIILLVVRWHSLTPAVRIALLMSLAVTGSMVGTLPLPQERYLFVVVAPLALVGGFGTAEVVSAFAAELRQKAKGR